MLTFDLLKAKLCSECGPRSGMLPLSAFHRQAMGRGGLSASCKSCFAARYNGTERRTRRMAEQRHAKWKTDAGFRAASMERNNSPTRRREHSEARILRLYGIDSEDVARMYDAQDRKCAGCRLPLKFDRLTNVDHDHATGRVRGLLCMPCNRGIGFLRESPASLRALAAYLEEE